MDLRRGREKGACVGWERGSGGGGRESWCRDKAPRPESHLI